MVKTSTQIKSLYPKVFAPIRPLHWFPVALGSRINSRPLLRSRKRLLKRIRYPSTADRHQARPCLVRPVVGVKTCLTMAQRDMDRLLEEHLEECEEYEVVAVVLVQGMSTATHYQLPMPLALRPQWECGEIDRSRR